LPLEPVDQRGQRAARQPEVAGQLGLAAAPVDREVGEGLALGGAQADGPGHDLPVVLAGEDEAAQVQDGLVHRRAVDVDVRLLS